jgi:hypothetical protein
MIPSEQEPGGVSLVLQLRAKLVAWKTKIASRLVVISRVLVVLCDQVLRFISGQDSTPIAKRIADWSIPLGLLLIGWLFSYLRWVTQSPPQVITQKIDGTAQVVAVNNAPAAWRHAHFQLRARRHAGRQRRRLGESAGRGMDDPHGLG